MTIQILIKANHFSFSGNASSSPFWMSYLFPFLFWSFCSFAFFLSRKEERKRKWMFSFLSSSEIISIASQKWNRPDHVWASVMTNSKCFVSPHWRIKHGFGGVHTGSQWLIDWRRSGWKSCSIKLIRVLVISCFPAVEKFYCFWWRMFERRRQWQR